MPKQEDIDNLSDLNRERLYQVLRIADSMKEKFPPAEIAKKMKVDKGIVSKYLNAKQGMSNNFYSTFMQTFGQPTPIPVQQDVNSFAGDIANRMLINEVKIEVLHQQVAQIMAQSTGRPAALILAELQQAVELTVKGKMDQLSNL